MEDVGVAALVIVAALKTSGYDVVGQASEGEGAIRLASQLRPDLVLMDINLGGAVDGIDAAETIRSRLGAPVVFLTAHSDEETLARARRAEPHGYLLKPLDPRMLRPTLEMALNRHAMEVERAELTRSLQEALAEVEQLRGLLPACAWCRRVKDDEGYWDTLEAYVGRRLSIQYTHGICDECAKVMEASLEARARDVPEDNDLGEDCR